MTANERKERIKKIRLQRIIISWVVVGVVCFMFGIVSYALTTHIIKPDSVSNEGGTNTSLETSASEFPIYGGYDDRVFTQEISMDWGAGDLDDFKPIQCSLDEDIQEFTYCLCKGYNLDFSLVMAIMCQESSFRVDVISKTNDYGLMQINQCNHDWLTETIGVTDFLDPYQNIRAGCFILRKLFEKYDDTDMVLMAYNMGESNAKRLWKNGVYSSSYSEKITAIQTKYYKELGVE